MIASLLGLDDDCVKRFKSNYKDALNGISGKGFSLLLGAVVGTLVLAVAADSTIYYDYFKSLG